MNDAVLGRIAAGQNLTLDEMDEVIDAVMSGKVPSQRIALLLTGLHAKGETVDEIAGAARAMRRQMTPIRCRRENLVDTCGTGGDGSGTFNISTAAALVAAAAGASVAKHGNRKITSKSGSADVLLQLGVNIEASPEVVQRCLDLLGIGFCFAPQLHPAMKHVAEVRRSLNTPTIFNLLGPLSNPASAPYQVLGVGRPELRDILAAVLQRLGARRAVVLSGDDGLDEITLATTTQATLVQQDQPPQHLVWSPETFGLSRTSLDALRAETPAESAALIRQVLQGQPGSPRDIVLLNAAAALWCAELASDLPAAARRAAQAIDSGAAEQLLHNLAKLSHETP